MGVLSEGTACVCVCVLGAVASVKDRVVRDEAT